MYEDRRSGFRRAALLCGCVMALIAIGCGDDDSDDEADASATQDSDTVEDVSLEGSWTGERSRVHHEEGTMEGDVTMDVEEQDGLTFTGTVTWSSPEGDMSGPMVGSMTPDGALMAGAAEDGMLTFEMVDAETLDYCYVEMGEEQQAVCGRLDKD